MSYKYRLLPGHDPDECWSPREGGTMAKGGQMGERSDCTVSHPFLKPAEKNKGNSTPERPSKDPAQVPWGTKIILTAPVYAAFIGFSLCRSLYGPTLGELQRLADTTLDTISTLFTCLGAGGIAGCLAFGCLFDRMDPLLLFVLTLTPLGMVTIFVPWWPHLVVMMGLSAAQSFFFTGISVGCNVVVMRLWGSRARAVLTTMHFLFTVGGFLAPQIAEPFIWSHEGVLSNLTASSGASAVLPIATPSMPCQLLKANQSSVGKVGQLYRTPGNLPCIPLHVGLRNSTIQIDSSKDSSELSTLSEAVPESQIHYAFLIVGVYLELVSMWMTVVYLVYRGRFTWAPSMPAAAKTSTRGLCSLCSHSVNILATVFFFLFNSFFGGKEMMYWGLLYTFAMEQVNMGAKEAAFLVSMHFAMYGLGRFLVVFVASRLAPRYIVGSAILVGCGAALLLSLFPGPGRTIMWLSNVLTGLSLATVFSVGLLWAETFVPVTGCFTSAYVIAYTLGMMTWPAVTGYLYKHSGPMWFAHMNSLLIIGCTICACALNLLWCRKYGKQGKFGEKDTIRTIELKEYHINSLDPQKKAMSSPCLHP